ncbi:MAG: PhzF family phenazine biosynthesis protein [Bacteroidetes bacterium]|jgi:PhzF family phenazine biosynthesis protein|nr:PhzF family phenazine biosynthesis protein [Bacteroidota bacterium]MDF1865363.1 PhzF family phenazine biosynthesis protein [Saprospiraceae bacterium]
MKQKIYQVDAFSQYVFGGNPAAVCPLDEWLTDDLMQKIALENNLSETAFFVPENNGFHIRWFTPTTEVDLCGHATLAAGHVILQHLNYSKDQIVFYSRSGELGIKKEDEYYILNFPTDKIKKVEIPQPIIDSIDINILECYQGREDFIAVVGSQQEVEQVNPNFEILKKLKARGVLVTSRGETVDFVSRCFFPAFGVDEDPVTGSAHTTLTPFWANKLGKTTLIAKQISARAGDLICKLKGDRVEIGGKAVTYLVGEISIP